MEVHIRYFRIQKDNRNINNRQQQIGRELCVDKQWIGIKGDRFQGIVWRQHRFKAGVM